MTAGQGFHADGWYDRTKPWNRPPRWSYSGPNDGPMERRVQEALNAVTQPGAELADIVRPPLDQVQLFRPRFGYRRRCLSITDIIEVDRVYRNPPNFTQTESGNEAAPRNSWGSGLW